MKRGGFTIALSIFSLMGLLVGLYGLYHVFMKNQSGVTPDYVLTALGLGFGAISFAMKLMHDSLTHQIDQSSNSLGTQLTNAINSINQRINDHLMTGHPRK